VLRDLVDLARVEEDPAAVRALVDLDPVQLDLLEIHAALRALHVVHLLDALFLLGRHLRRLLLRPLLAALELLPCKVFVFGLAGLVDITHGPIIEAWEAN
jgi:hypothetical protein